MDEWRVDSCALGLVYGTPRHGTKWRLGVPLFCFIILQEPCSSLARETRQCMYVCNGENDSKYEIEKIEVHLTMSCYCVHMVYSCSENKNSDRQNM